MIRKSTLIILIVALLLGGGVYYYETKHSAPAPSTDAEKPVFASMQPTDIQTVAISHPGKPDTPAVQIERRSDNWEIVKPIDTPADLPSVGGIVDGIAQASSSTSEPGTPDRLKAYGLDPGALQIEFTVKGGAKHKILLGDKDFTGSYVYSVVDSAQNVTLLPISLLTSVDKSSEDLRDHSVLHVDSEQVASFELKNPSGDVAAKKAASVWNLTRPDAAPADSDAILSLLSSLSTARMAAVSSETPANPEKYGLANPSITLTLTNDIGRISTLVVGKKQGANYFARDTSRPTVFQIDDDLYKKLTQSVADLLDKTPLHFEEADISHFEIHGSSGTITASRKPGGDDWVIDAPDAQKGKTAISWKVLSPVSGLRAEQVIQKPSAEITAGLAHPAYELILTDKSGKKLSLRISKEVGDFVYGQSSQNPAVFKLRKQALSDLDVKPADLAS